MYVLADAPAAAYSTIRHIGIFSEPLYAPGRLGTQMADGRQATVISSREPIPPPFLTISRQYGSTVGSLFLEFTSLENGCFKKRG